MRGIHWSIAECDVPSNDIMITSDCKQRLEHKPAKNTCSSNFPCRECVVKINSIYLQVNCPCRGSQGKGSCIACRPAINKILSACTPTPHETLCDRRMGPCDMFELCHTCQRSLGKCPGHFGNIPLCFPVVPEHFWSFVVSALNMICHECLQFKKLKRCECKAQTKVTGDKEKLHFMVNTSLLSFNDAYTLLARIPDETWKSIGGFSNPKNCFMYYFPVLPICARPYVKMADGWKPDPMTVAYADIIRCNTTLKHRLEEISQNVFEHETRLKSARLDLIAAVRVVFDGANKRSKTRTLISGIFSRLNGKEGRFRQNLMGGRVNQSGRAVISPDPDIRIDEVGIPYSVAQTLTISERVSQYNIAKLSRIGISVTKPDGQNYDLSLKGIKQHAIVQIGDNIERPLQNGDVVLFNRQPSLHRASIMAHIVRVLPHCTFRLNPSACFPYNADFDGDEMNIHVPQSLEAQVEARVIMGVADNIVSPQTGSAIMSLIFDTLLGTFLLTTQGKLIGREDMMQFSMYGKSPGTIPHPTIMLSRSYASSSSSERFFWTGKSVMSMVLPSTFYLNWNHDGITKSCDMMMIPDNRSVVICAGELLLGRFNKSNVHDITQALYHDEGPQSAADFLSITQPFINQWLRKRGISLSMSDVTINNVNERKALTEFIQTHISQEKEFISERDAMIKMQILRDKSSTRAVRHIHTDNNMFLSIVESGSKGGAANVTQIAAVLGQQTLNGGRIPTLRDGRSLPHFSRHSKDPHSRGFVSSNFSIGLGGVENYHHAVSGREGVVDMGVKTAKAGYMARRMMKSMEGITVCHDGTVRINQQDIVQFRYGEDGIRPNALRPIPVIDACTTSSLVEEEIMLQRARRLLNNRAVVSCPIGFDVLERALPPASSIEEILPSAIDVFNIVKAHCAINTIVALLISLRYSSPNVLARKWNLETLRTVLLSITRAEEKALVDAGESVGAIAAQCISQIVTQMTLNTFHLAGMAKAITKGLPRMEEIIDAVEFEKTPLLTVTCDESTMNNAIRGISFMSLTQYMQIEPVGKELEMWEANYMGVFGSIETYAYRITIRFHRKRLREMGLTMQQQLQLLVRKTIGEDNTRCITHSDDAFMFPIPTMHIHLNVPLEVLQKRILPKLRTLMISGLSSCTYDVMIEDEKHPNVRSVLGVPTSPYNPIAETWAISSLDHTKTICSNMFVVALTLGIEAACAIVRREMLRVMHGVSSLNVKHIQLLVDAMSHHGVMFGVKSGGVSKQHDSMFARASYEKTKSVITEGAIKNHLDFCNDISLSIGIGVLVPTGTGMGIELIPDTVMMEPTATTTTTSRWGPLPAAPIVYQSAPYSPSQHYEASHHQDEQPDYVVASPPPEED